ncbi:MAG: alpha/beta fold hydrolase, partial [Dehalococcoidia bacterium]|nr:alpha/beta fold hydrolase [Dehalococcoidia bacterium]
MTRLLTTLALAAATLDGAPHALAAPAPKAAVTRSAPPVIHYKTATVDGVKVFYREAGPADGPVVLLLHGFPTSSHMFRNLIPLLADKYRVIAPDYPGYGQSDAPDHTKFAYTFANQADIVDKLVTQIGAKRYTMYVMDYGAPIGYRLALKHPERVSGLIVQNGSAYNEGLQSPFLSLTHLRAHETLRQLVCR